MPLLRTDGCERDSALQGAPNKVRRVLDTIRGRPYEEALMILEYMPYRACEPILKVRAPTA